MGARGCEGVQSCVKGPGCDVVYETGLKSRSQSRESKKLRPRSRSRESKSKN